MDIKDEILNGIFHFYMLKQVFLRTAKDPISILANLKQITNLWIGIKDENKL